MPFYADIFPHDGIDDMGGFRCSGDDVGFCGGSEGNEGTEVIKVVVIVEEVNMNAVVVLKGKTRLKISQKFGCVDVLFFGNAIDDVFEEGVEVFLGGGFEAFFKGTEGENNANRKGAERGFIGEKGVVVVKSALEWRKPRWEMSIEDSDCLKGVVNLEFLKEREKFLFGFVFVEDIDGKVRPARENVIVNEVGVFRGEHENGRDVSVNQ